MQREQSECKRVSDEQVALILYITQREGSAYL